MKQSAAATTFPKPHCADGLRFLCPRMRMAVKIRLIPIYSPRHIRPDCPLVSHQARYIICCLISFYCGFALLLSCGLAWVSPRLARPSTVVFVLLSFEVNLLPICFARPSTIVFRLLSFEVSLLPIRLALPSMIVFKLLSFEVSLLPICFARPSTIVFRLMHHKLA